ncbi:SCO family protein [Sphingomonas sp. HMWF008]|nr:SCO family protein [Sphingomonas sp. HMWF008]
MPSIDRLSRWRTLRIALWALVALGVGAFAYLSFGDKKAMPVTETASAQANYARQFGGRFAMTDTTGKAVTDQTLKGKPFAIFFGFTRCPDVCPTTLSRMASLRKQLGHDGDKFNIVFVTVDPDHDSQQSLGQYLALFGTPIIGLRGTKAQLDAIVKAYRVTYVKVPTSDVDYTIDHTASVYLMGRTGEFVTTIDHAEDPATALAKLKRLMTER